eukprot:550130_1
MAAPRTPPAPWRSTHLLSTRTPIATPPMRILWSQCIQIELDCQTIQLAKSTHKSKANPTGKVDTSKWTKPEQKKVDTSKWVKPKPPPAPKTKPKTVQKPPPAPSKNNDDYKKQST